MCIELRVDSVYSVRSYVSSQFFLSPFLSECIFHLCSQFSLPSLYQLESWRLCQAYGPLRTSAATFSSHRRAVTPAWGDPLVLAFSYFFLEEQLYSVLARR